MLFINLYQGWTEYYEFTMFIFSSLLFFMYKPLLIFRLHLPPKTLSLCLLALAGQVLNCKTVPMFFTLCPGIYLNSAPQLPSVIFSQNQCWGRNTNSHASDTVATLRCGLNGLEFSLPCNMLLSHKEILKPYINLFDYSFL